LLAARLIGFSADQVKHRIRQRGAEAARWVESITRAKPEKVEAFVFGIQISWGNSFHVGWIGRIRNFSRHSMLIAGISYIYREPPKVS